MPGGQMIFSTVSSGERCSAVIPPPAGVPNTASSSWGLGHQFFDGQFWRVLFQGISAGRHEFFNGNHAVLAPNQIEPIL